MSLCGPGGMTKNLSGASFERVLWFPRIASVFALHQKLSQRSGREPRREKEQAELLFSLLLK